MDERQQLAARALGAIRSSQGFKHLPDWERRALSADMDKLAAALGTGIDPYASVLETPLDFQRQMSGGPVGGRSSTASQSVKPAGGAAAKPPATATIGERAGAFLEAVDFPGFVAGLVTGTFQAVVDATAQQIQQYADLVHSLASTVDEFSRENVSNGQVREFLINRHPKDLYQLIPPPGAEGSPRIVPHENAVGTSPKWLEDYGLSGESLDEELAEGPLMTAGRRSLAQDRMKTLATTLLLGINRVVVDEGHIKARMQFHAVARDQTAAQVQNLNVGQSGGIAGRHTSGQSAATTMVSTVKANAQADSGIRADLMGEVQLKFSSQTFPIERFANPEMLEVLTRHSGMRRETSEPSDEARTASPPGGNATNGDA